MVKSITHFEKRIIGLCYVLVLHIVIYMIELEVLLFNVAFEEKRCYNYRNKIYYEVI